MDRLPNTDLTGQAWYCARTQPKHEHIAARNLRNRLGLEVFQPRLRIERATQRGVVRLVEPLFPCYVFVRCRLEEQADLVRYTHGVSSLVHFGASIPSVPEHLIQELKQCFDSDESIVARDPIQVGSEVFIADGSLAGSRGIVVRMLPAKQRVQILLDFLGRTTVTEVDRKSLVLEEETLASMMPGLALAAA